MIFIFPYIFMMMFQDIIQISKTLMISITLFATLGFNLKPYFFLIFIVAEIAYLTYHRSFKNTFRLQTLIIGFSGLIYLSIIYIFFKEYIDFLIPLAIKAYSSVFEKSFFSLILVNDILLIGMFIIFFFLFAYKRHHLDLTIILYLIPPLLFLYFYQQKGWHYHLLPALMFSSFSFMYILIYYVKKENYKFAMFAGILIFLIIYENRYINRYENVDNVLSTLTPNSKVIILSEDIALCLPLVVQNGHTWCSRFPSLWMLPKIVKDSTQIKLEKYMIDSIYEDILKYKPNYIMTGSYQYSYIFKPNEHLDALLSSHYKLLNNPTTLIYQKIKEIE